MARASIIIPAFNAAATINATIESAAGQSCSDWEAIIFDAGSTDITA
jgi:glycosyltransferase involved in cell wall biosynthesis